VFARRSDQPRDDEYFGPVRSASVLIGWAIWGL
jgi:hypothetical protein